MRKPLMSNSMRKVRMCVMALAPIALTSLPACTDLSEIPTSSITPDNFYRNSDEVLGGVASVYAALRGTLWGFASTFLPRHWL